MSSDCQIIPFNLQSDATQVFLVGQKDQEEPFVIEMQQCEPGFWIMRLELHPGVYRFRYYCNNGQNIVYLGPAHSAQSTVDDMDAVLVISQELRGRIGRDFPVCPAMSMPSPAHA